MGINPVPVEKIPFLFQSIKDKRRKSAQFTLLNSAVLGGLIIGHSYKEPNLRHLTVFLALATVLPMISGFRCLRAAQALTPEKLAREVAKSQNLAGSVFSLYLSSDPSVGASGGILGLAGFLFMACRRPGALPLADVPMAVATTACLTAFIGIVAYDLFDNAAHLGGLLAGLGLGWIIKNPKKLTDSRAFRLCGITSCLVLCAGAVMAMYLMTIPVREPAVIPDGKGQPQRISSRAKRLHNLQHSRSTFVRRLTSCMSPFPDGTKPSGHRLIFLTGCFYAGAGRRGSSRASED